MAVYILNNMTIHDRAEYDSYLRAFLGVFRKFDGEILAAQDAPEPVEGAWPYDRTILLRFPSREAAQRWYESPEYRAIAEHRLAGTKSNVVILDGLPSSDSRPGRPARWRVWRQDEHGNRFEVSRGHSEDEARRRAAELESRGHKQGYGVEPE